VLTNLDETLRHQLPTTFDHVGTSDPRFYDRVWFCCYDPEGSLAVITSVGLYANMNVMDGFVSLMTPKAGGGGDQHNFRFSRILRPEIDEVAVGPLSVEILEPYQRIRLRVKEGEFPVGLDLEWRAEFPPVEEEHHFSRHRGRVTQDYRRYSQLGSASGVVTLRDRRWDVSSWFSARDHSWGVRTQVAGPEPVTGPTEYDSDFKGVLFYWLPFLTDELGGYVQFHTDGDRNRSYMDGVIARRDGTTKAVVDAELDLEMHDGTRRWKRAELTLTAEDGERFELLEEPLMRCFSMDGTGYDWGWNDDQGLGVYRGEYYTEADVYDLSHPEKVVRPDGQVRTPMHRETATRLTLNGRPGTGHQVLVAVGPMPGYGLD
jgi:hypothetical protein